MEGEEGVRDMGLALLHPRLWVKRPEKLLSLVLNLLRLAMLRLGDSEPLALRDEVPDAAGRPCDRPQFCLLV